MIEIWWQPAVYYTGARSKMDVLGTFCVSRAGEQQHAVWSSADTEAATASLHIKWGGGQRATMTWKPPPQGSPAELLSRADGVFSSMVRETGEASERFLRSLAKGEASGAHRRTLDRQARAHEKWKALVSRAVKSWFYELDSPCFASCEALVLQTAKPWFYKLENPGFARR